MSELNYAAIGQKLQQLRKAKNITQDYIATALNVTVAYISNVENNKVKLNLRVITYYAKLLGVSVDYLLFTDKDGSTETSSLDTEIMKLLSNYSDEEKEKLIKVLKVLKDL